MRPQVQEVQLGVPQIETIWILDTGNPLDTCISEGRRFPDRQQSKQTLNYEYAGKIKALKIQTPKTEPCTLRENINMPRTCRADPPLLVTPQFPRRISLHFQLIAPQV